ncbi:MAG: hypothetical protein HYX54_03175 [Chloroflexi bacterium]|nr:hypothetical protein [Chloroflexota bacterium]
MPSSLSGRSGRFVVRVDPKAPIAEFMEADGTINFDLRAMSDQSGSVVAFSRRLEGPRWTTQGPSGERLDAESLDLSVTLDQPLAPADAVEAPTAVTDKIFPCPDFVVATYNGVVGIVGEV